MNTQYHNTVAPPRNGKSPNPFSSKAFKPSKKKVSSSAVSESLNKREVIDRLQQQAFGDSAKELRVSIVPTPDHMAIVPGQNRYSIRVTQYDCEWWHPIQWTDEDDMGTIRWFVDVLPWDLDKNTGRPIYLEDIDRILESWVDCRKLEYRLIKSLHNDLEVA